MERVSEIIGTPIVSAANGEKVGNVADVLLGAEGDRVVGVVVRRGAFAGEQVLPYEDVQAVGRDAVIARSEEGVVGSREWHDRGGEAARSSTLTADGRELGRIKDLYVDAQSGAIRAYEVEGHRLAGLITKRAALPRSDRVTIGPDDVLGPADAARVFDGDGHEPPRD